MARAVRIARAEAVGGSGGPAEAAATGGFTPNLGGLTRAGRLFALFVVLLGASYAVFLGLLFGGPAPNSSAVAPSIELLTALAALLLVSAFWITLARTPRGVERRTGRLVVVEFLGGRRVFPSDATLRFTVENRYGTGFLSDVPTEMVAVQSARGPVRHYLVERDLLGGPSE